MGCCCRLHRKSPVSFCCLSLFCTLLQVFYRTARFISLFTNCTCPSFFFPLCGLSYPPSHPSPLLFPPPAKTPSGICSLNLCCGCLALFLHDVCVFLSTLSFVRLWLISSLIFMAPNPCLSFSSVCFSLSPGKEKNHAAESPVFRGLSPCTHSLPLGSSPSFLFLSLSLHAISYSLHILPFLSRSL